MYRVEERVYTDCEGKYSDWEKGYGYVATIEEAKAIAATIKRTSNWDTGDWRIIARTMDEEAFTVEDIIVENYDWWKEVGRYDNARKNGRRRLPAAFFVIRNRAVLHHRFPGLQTRK